LMQSGGQFDAQLRRIQGEAIDYNHVHASAQLIRIYRRFWREAVRNEADSRDVPSVEIACELLGLNPRRAKDFERRIGSAPHRDVCAFDQGNAWIKRVLRQIAQVRRWIYPLLTDGIEPVSPLPSLHRNHCELGAELLFAVEQLREFANRHPVTRWGHVIGDVIAFV